MSKKGSIYRTEQENTTTTIRNTSLSGWNYKLIEMISSIYSSFEKSFFFLSFFPSRLLPSPLPPSPFTTFPLCHLPPFLPPPPSPSLLPQPKTLTLDTGAFIRAYNYCYFVCPPLPFPSLSLWVLSPSNMLSLLPLSSKRTSQ